MTSLRQRLLIPLGVGLTLLLVLGAVILYGAVAGNLNRSFDDALLDRARSLASHLELQVETEHRVRVAALGASAFGDPVDADARHELLALAPAAFTVQLTPRALLDPNYAPGDDAAYFEIRLDDGRTPFRSPSLGIQRLAIDEPPHEDRGLTTLDLPDGRRGRVVWLDLGEVPFADPVWQRAWDGIRGSARVPALRAHVLVAETTESVDAFLRTLGGGLAGFLAVLVVGGAILAFFLVRRALAPLTELREEIAALDPAALQQRVALARPPRELTPVVEALNQRLAALEEAFDRERRTTAHIAHELRTPIAELRTLTEVALQFPDDPELAKQSLEHGHEAALHMSKIVEAVLRLARARAPADASAREPLELRPLVDEAWNTLRASAAARGQAIDAHVAKDLVVNADREAVHALIANLLGNAVRHAPEGSTIHVGSRSAEDRLILDVANPCNNLEAEDLDRLVEPFWRKDEARAESELGGLGLALARAWAQTAGVDLSFTLEGETFTASLGFPVT